MSYLLALLLLCAFEGLGVDLPQGNHRLTGET